MQRLSTKMSKFSGSCTLQTRELVRDRLIENLPVFDFALGEAKGEIPADIREAGIEAFRNNATGYHPPAGLPELREEVLRWLGIEGHYTRYNVVIGVGAKQCIHNVFSAICDPGDVVLFDTAPWVSYSPLASCTGAVPIPLNPANKTADFKSSPDDLLRALRVHPHARLFLLNSPCNPTGQLYSGQEIRDFLDICIENEMFFVLDRLYWKTIFDGKRYPEPPLNSRTKPWLIQLDGLSKSFRSCGGLRIGWSIAPEDITQAMTNIQSHTTSGPAVPSQYAALKAISGKYDREMQRDLEMKRDLFYKLAKRIPYVEPLRTQASFYSFWDVRQALGLRSPKGKKIDTSEQLTTYLVDQAGVATLPGSAFLLEGYLRLSFHNDIEMIKAGLEAAKQAFEALG